nr:NosD domain-containing protein [Candidatus Sigynarchaeum springense]
MQNMDLTGISIKSDSSSITILSNTFDTSNQCAILIQSGEHDISIVNNVIESTQIGILLMDAYRVVIDQNMFMDNAIAINWNTMDHFIGPNEITRNYIVSGIDGLFLNGVYDAIIEQNVISRNQGTAIDVVGIPTSNTMITANYILCNQIGMNFDLQFKGFVWNNVLIQNSLQVQILPFIDATFYYEGIGNYWSDYATRYPGAINDGVKWNQPYTILDGISDLYPLVRGTINAISLTTNPDTYSWYCTGTGALSSPYVLKDLIVTSITISGNGFLRSLQIINAMVSSSLQITTASDIRITGCLFTSNSGMAIIARSSPRIVVELCIFKAGVIFVDSSTFGIGSINIKDNTFASCSYGITLSHSDFSIVTGNLFLNCYVGIMKENSNFNLILGNAFIGCVYSIIDPGSHNTFTNNTFQGGTIGIQLLDSTFDVIQNNTFTDMETSVIIDGATTMNTVSINSFINNSRYAVIIQNGATGNIISNNTFVDNNNGGVQAQSH